MMEIYLSLHPCADKAGVLVKTKPDKEIAYMAATFFTEWLKTSSIDLTTGVELNTPYAGEQINKVGDDEELLLSREEANCVINGLHLQVEEYKAKLANLNRLKEKIRKGRRRRLEGVRDEVIVRSSERIDKYEAMEKAFKSTLEESLRTTTQAT